MGWLARKYGLQTNSVTAIELVTADGDLVRADAEHEPDLFWALRGGGGNFGVVTAIEFAVYPVEELYAGAMFFPFERASEVLHAWRELLPDVPRGADDVGEHPALPAAAGRSRSRSAAARSPIVMGALPGRGGGGPRAAAPLRDLGPAIDTFAMVPPIELGELAMDPPDPLPFSSGHELLGELPADAIDELLASPGPSPGSGTPSR